MSDQQHVLPDDEQLFDPLSQPPPPPQVATEAGLGGGPKTGLRGTPLDVVRSVFHRLLPLVLLLPVRLVVAAV